MSMPPTPERETEQRPGWNAEEAQERAALREALRVRLSVDRFARGWYGGLVSALLTGLLVLWSPQLGATLRPALAAGLVLAWGLVIGQFLGCWRAADREARMLSRLSELDARGPLTPELF